MQRSLIIMLILNEKMKKQIQDIMLVATGFVVLVMLSCKTSQSLEEQQRNAQEIEQYLQNSSFEIEHRWMQPLRGNQISLIGNPNYVRLYSKDSLSIFLPYFGVRQFSGGYGSASGIEFTGKPKALQITENEKGNQIITFSGTQQTEAYDFKITIYPNKNVKTFVRSNQRDNISYDGRIQELDTINE